jgi:hypothetical protein
LGVRGFITLVALFLILVVGGGLTSMLIANEGGTILPIQTTTTIPDASPTVVLPWKAEQFFLLTGFLLFNLIGIAVTLAIIFWYVDRQLRRSRAEEAEKTGTRAVAKK